MPTKAQVFTKPDVALPSLSRVLPPALSPNIYSWVLQVAKDNPQMKEEEVIRIANMLSKVSQSSKPLVIQPLETITPKEKSPMLTSPIVSPPLSPFSQSPLSLKDIFCHKCGQTGHLEFMCASSPIREFDCSLGPRCDYCGLFGHIRRSCPTLHKSSKYDPTPVDSQESSSKQRLTTKVHTVVGPTGSGGSPPGPTT